MAAASMIDVMSLSVSALCAAAVDADPAGQVDVGGHSLSTILALDRRSQDAAGVLLASGTCPGAAIRVAPAPGPQRSVGLLAVWRVGLVVTADPAAPSAEQAATGTPTQRENRENLRRVAESGVWSETPAAVTTDGATLTHADLLRRLDPSAGPVAIVESLLRY